MNSQAVILIIVCAIAIYVPLGGWAVFTLIQIKADPGLIAVLSGMTGTALGALTSMLNNTRTSVAPTGTAADPIQTTNVNPPDKPVNTTDSHL